MAMTLNTFIFRIKSLIKYKIKAKSSLSIHSPFLFEFYSAIKKPEPLNDNEEKKLLSIRKKLSEDKSSLVFKDPGSKGGIIDTKVNEIYKRTAKSSKQAHSIAAVAKYIQAKNILELGTAFGTTSLTIQYYNPKAKIISIEGVKEIAAIAEKSKELCFSNAFEIRKGLFNKLLPEVIKEFDFIDFAFIDGHHTSKATLEYLDIIYPTLSSKFILIIDDIYYSKDMESCWNKLMNDKRFNASIDLFHFGILIKNPDIHQQNHILNY